MNGRELMQAIFAGEPFERLPVPGIYPWAEAEERWHREGLPYGKDCNDALGLISEDREEFPLDINMVPRLEIKVLGVDEDYVTLVDEYGITKRMLRADFSRSGGFMDAAGAMSSMSHWIDFPVKTLADWRPLYEQRFRPSLEGRLPADWDMRKLEWKERCRTRWVDFFCFPLGGLFGGLRQLMGLEGLIYAIADDPALIHTIVDDLSEFWLGTFDVALRDARIDRIMFFEDMCATKGPLIGPAMYREFIAPGYRKLVGELHSMGVQELWADSDGNFAPLLPEVMSCGFTGISPCEINSGMYPEELHEAFPRLNMAGGIDKRVLARGAADIEAEIVRRYRAAWANGHYVPSLDHGAPPDIPWVNAGHYARLTKECCARRVTFMEERRGVI